MEQLFSFEKPEIFNIPFELSSEITGVDFNLTEPGTVCHFYSPERKIRERKLPKIKTGRKIKLDADGFHRCQNPVKIL